VLAFVETAELLEVAWTSAAACIGITVAYALAVVGADRAVDYGRAGRPLEAGAFALLSLAGAVFVLAALAAGVAVMVDW
jgi:hypothetical protein